MPLWLIVVVQVLFVLVVLLGYNLLKIPILSKLNPNKWVVLGIAMASFLIPLIATYYGYNLNGTIWQYIQTGVFVVFFLWFLDLRNGPINRNSNSRSNNGKKDVVIKPKAKPNRVKNK